MLSYVLYTTYFMFVCALFGNSKQRYERGWRQIFIILTFGFMLFMMACRRSDVGNDTQSYIAFFRQMKAGNLYFDRRVEIGFRYLTILISHFTNSVQIYLACCVLLTFIPYLIFLLHTSDNIEFSIALFWVFGCEGVTSASRQGLAIGIILLGYLLLRKGKRGSTILYFLFCGIASLFHTAAIVLIVMPLFRRKKITIKAMAIITILAFGLTATNLVTTVFSRFVGDYYSLYTNVQSGWAGALFNMMMGVSAYIFEYLSLGNEERKQFVYSEEDYRDGRMEKRDKDELNFLRWATMFSVTCCILSVNSGIMGREAMFFNPFLNVYMTNHVVKIKYSRFIMVGILVARVGYSMLALVIRPEWNSFFPFFFFWQ